MAKKIAIFFLFIFLAINLAISKLLLCFVLMSEELMQYLKEAKFLTIAKLERDAGLHKATIHRVLKGAQYRHFTDDQAAAIHRSLMVHYKRLKKYLESIGEKV